MSHFETDYEDGTSFDERNAANHKIIREKYIPSIKDAGMSVNLKQDVDPIELSDDDKKDYPNPNDFTAYAGIRSPDLMAIDGRIRIANILGLSIAYMEVKDFPQLSKYNATGCEARLVMRYLAIQHLCRLPLVMLFRDEDRPATERLPELKSAFGRTPYGGLIWDLDVHEGSMSPRIPHVKEGKFGKREFPQILWRAQNPFDGKPFMSPIQEIAELLRSGKVSMKSVDPTGFPLWNTLNGQRWEEWPEELRQKPMIVPKGGLVVFTEN